MEEVDVEPASELDKLTVNILERLVVVSLQSIDKL